MTMTRLASPEDVKKSIKQLAAAVLDRCQDNRRMVLVGIQTRGAILAERIARLIDKDTGTAPELGRLDINFYRDDLSRIGHQPVLRKTDIPCSLDGRDVFLIDDVLYTGRTIRAALDALVDFGRPACVRLLVLVDRGGRELPIQADWAAFTESVAPNKSVDVKLQECDGEEGIDVVDVSQ